jgi:hypothetical protein
MLVSRVITGAVFIFVATVACLVLGAAVSVIVAETIGAAGFGALDVFLAGTFGGLMVGLIASLVMAFRLDRVKLVKGIWIGLIGIGVEAVLLVATDIIGFW